LKLAIISHTEHFHDAQGCIVGWGPTVRELNHLLGVFDEIWHVAVLHKGEAPASALPYTSDRIHFIPIKPFGGSQLKDKLDILRQAPQVVRTIRHVLQGVDCWQFRAPTGIGVFLVPWLSLMVSKPGWFKYAGNWMQENRPPGYLIQRLWLSRMQSRPVTINGRWPNQPAHCLSFANPCLDGSERNIGKATIKLKEYGGPLHLCFVGRLESAKGIDLLMDALAALPAKSRIACLHLVGDGPLRAYCEMKASALPFEVKLYGFQSRHAVGHIMEACHLLILPSKAEGFPKVIAEGANYGCVPVVSDISGIAQYVHHGITGFLLSPDRLKQGALVEDLQVILSSPDLKSIAESAYHMAADFTFERYGQRIWEEILRLPA